MLFAGLVPMLLAAGALAIRGPHDSPSVSVKTESYSTASQPAAPHPTTLSVTHVPSGFILQKNVTDSVQSMTVLERMYLKGNRETGPQGSIYIRAFLAGRPSNIDEQRSALPRATDVTVHGKAALLSRMTEGPGHTVIQWFESPTVMISVSSRGPLAREELMAVAEGVSIR